MTFENSVFNWFYYLDSHKRMLILCDLIHMCHPLELLFFSTYVRQLCDVDGFKYRINQNQRDSIFSVESFLSPLDDATRKKMLIFLCFLTSKNDQNLDIFREKIGCMDIITEFCRESYSCVIDNKKDDLLLIQRLNELQLLYTLALLHPVFTFHFKKLYADIYFKLDDLRKKLNNKEPFVDELSIEELNPCEHDGICVSSECLCKCSACLSTEHVCEVHVNCRHLAAEEPETEVVVSWRDGVTYEISVPDTVVCRLLDKLKFYQIDMNQTEVMSRKVKSLSADDSVFSDCFIWLHRLSKDYAIVRQWFSTLCYDGNVCVRDSVQSNNGVSVNSDENADSNSISECMPNDSFLLVERANNCSYLVKHVTKFMNFSSNKLRTLADSQTLHTLGLDSESVIHLEAILQLDNCQHLHDDVVQVKWHNGSTSDRTSSLSDCSDDPAPSAATASLASMRVSSDTRVTLHSAQLSQMGQLYHNQDIMCVPSHAYSYMPSVSSIKGILVPSVPPPIPLSHLPPPHVARFPSSGVIADGTVAIAPFIISSAACIPHPTCPPQHLTHLQTQQPVHVRLAPNPIYLPHPTYDG